MTEMVHGTIPIRDGEPILPRWWRTVDRWSLTCVLLLFGVGMLLGLAEARLASRALGDGPALEAARRRLFGVGMLLGLAASPPLAERNGLDPFHYVERQAIFGTLALFAMIVVSMLPPVQVRRLATLGFAVSFVALIFLPLFGTDFGKGATRWYSIGFGSVQPSEFLKPGFIVAAAWLIAASQDLQGPPGKRISS